MTTVIISVPRNPSTPTFPQSNYAVTIPETTALGSVVIFLNATDADNVSEIEVFRKNIHFCLTLILICTRRQYRSSLTLWQRFVWVGVYICVCVCTCVCMHMCKPTIIKWTVDRSTVFNCIVSLKCDQDSSLFCLLFIISNLEIFNLFSPRRFIPKREKNNNYNIWVHDFHKGY